MEQCTDNLHNRFDWSLKADDRDAVNAHVIALPHDLLRAPFNTAPKDFTVRVLRAGRRRRPEARRGEDEGGGATHPAALQDVPVRAFRHAAGAAQQPDRQVRRRNLPACHARAAPALTKSIALAAPIDGRAACTREGGAKPRARPARAHAEPRSVGARDRTRVSGGVQDAGQTKDGLEKLSGTMHRALA